MEENEKKPDLVTQREIVDSNLKMHELKLETAKTEYETMCKRLEIQSLINEISPDLSHIDKELLEIKADNANNWDSYVNALEAVTNNFSGCLSSIRDLADKLKITNQHIDFVKELVYQHSKVSDNNYYLIKWLLALGISANIINILTFITLCLN